MKQKSLIFAQIIKYLEELNDVSLILIKIICFLLFRAIFFISCKFLLENLNNIVKNI